MNRILLLATSLVCAVPFVHAEGKENSPGPTGPQTDGHFRKVILDSDKQQSKTLNGNNS